MHFLHRMHYEGTPLMSHEKKKKKKPSFSQKYRTPVWLRLVGRGLWKLSGPTLLLKRVHPRQIVHDRVQGRIYFYVRMCFC